MTFVITQNCCTDASCIPVCPVDCIRPVPNGTAAPMLYIDPNTCVDCGACMAECPVGAIYHEDELPAGQRRFLDINAAYFDKTALKVRDTQAKPAPRPLERGALRVAIVGSGPAACYAAAELVHTPGVEVHLFDRLPTPFGLIRSGVAPDHQATKQIVSVFEPVLASDRVSCHFNVEVGRDVTHAELTEHHDAVIYAVGASRSRDLGIPGEHLAGHHAVADFVAWYNGHPDHAHHEFDFGTSRVVIIGNGNVALDAARVLVSDTETLAQTDIADHSLRALAASAVQEVVLLARRGAAHGAFSVGELIALGELPGVDVVVRGELGERPDDLDGALKYDLITEYAMRPRTPGNRVVALVFSAPPLELVGTENVEGVRLETGIIETGLVFRSIGYRGAAIDGVPFDEAEGRVPNDEGRVVDAGEPLPGVYVAGWIKRGPQGVIGTNRTCAQQTVGHLMEDFAAGKLRRRSDDDISELLTRRGVQAVDWAGWLAIDAAERARGAAAARPRAKFVEVGELVGAARI
ncbi:ferredoxin [Mycolicibacterium moriokaense]|uniref:ferredoxin--NADP(+) reductase n=1 Tax=Mycolicibacterium moriokaense TaxID=39691 RepID=A0AAD1M437_9MYCO|nr:FAD-dependent oxidoreductase [Mycolicibacterium moriokaense]MCV7037888.1 FAD-dependent oxidoreductase [Mycolicibacterium moriokaense]ORB19664.1 ferredoxin [Mycolicibacterium moriokaense]BBW99672.1 ferredoxin [Mycolicibacterium moriokaense]